MESERNRSTLDRILDGLSIGQYSTMGALHNATDGDSKTSMWDGFTQGLQAGNPFGNGHREWEYSFADTLTSFSKIHLDASMSCADDPVPLGPAIVAERAARLCQAAEETATDEQKRHLTYVIGTEVPVPGGEASTIGSVHVTRAQDAAATLETHEAAFRKLGLNAALERVIAIVVQPGVEFDHTQIIHYQPEALKALSAWIEGTPMVTAKRTQLITSLVRPTGHWCATITPS